MITDIKKEYFQLSEDHLHHIVINTLSDSFTIRHEVAGRHLLENKGVRIDFLMYPKQRLIDQGFEPIWVGCEVKSPATKKKPITHIMDFAKQSIDYTESIFDGIVPTSVFMFPDLRHFFYAQKAMTDGYLHFLQLFPSFLQRFNVGTLHIQSKNTWGMRFGSQNYFSTLRGRGNVANFGTKRKIGSV
jgi:hypothetical protein